MTEKEKKEELVELLRKPCISVVVLLNPFKLVSSFSYSFTLPNTEVKADSKGRLEAKQFIEKITKK